MGDDGFVTCLWQRHYNSELVTNYYVGLLRLPRLHFLSISMIMLSLQIVTLGGIVNWNNRTDREAPQPSMEREGQ